MKGNGGEGVLSFLAKVSLSLPFVLCSFPRTRRLAFWPSIFDVPPADAISISVIRKMRMSMHPSLNAHRKCLQLVSLNKTIVASFSDWNAWSFVVNKERSSYRCQVTFLARNENFASLLRRAGFPLRGRRDRDDEGRHLSEIGQAARLCQESLWGAATMPQALTGTLRMLHVLFFLGNI